jgi:hypothetical protein
MRRAWPRHCVGRADSSFNCALWTSAPRLASSADRQRRLCRQVALLLAGTAAWALWQGWTVA